MVSIPHQKFLSCVGRLVKRVKNPREHLMKWNLDLLASPSVIKLAEI